MIEVIISRLRLQNYIKNQLKQNFLSLFSQKRLRFAT